MPFVHVNSSIKAAASFIYIIFITVQVWNFINPRSGFDPSFFFFFKLNS